MKHQDFQTLLDTYTPPPDIFPALQALWHQAKGDWDTGTDTKEKRGAK
jgi:hypothetical protein